jgi:hypothetical protein
LSRHTNIYLSGWGTTSSGGATSDKLLEVEVPVVTNAVCKTAMQTDVSVFFYNKTITFTNL